MRRISLLFALPLLVSSQLASAQQPPGQPPPRGTASFEPPPALAEDAPLTPQTFVVRAAIVNISETELAELALSRSQNAAIQSFARKMLDEHRRAQEKLRVVAVESKIALPGKADKKHQDVKASLKRAAADEFDAEFVKAMVAGHDDAVALFDGAARAKTLTQPLQRYAVEMLPVVRNHRDAAYALQSGANN
jgi:putative membrane protein